jgi:hypothetical protein
MAGLVDRVTQAVACWNTGDLDGYLTLYDDTIRLHGYAPAPMDKAAVTGFYRATFAGLTAPGAAAPVLEVFDPMASGEWYAAHFRMSGVHAGAFMGVPATGRPYAATGVTMMRFGPAGTVLLRHSAFDVLSILIQIGAVPPPPQ